MAQAHVALGRMHVGIDTIGGDVDEEHAERLAMCERERRVSRRPRTREQGRSQESAVDEEQLHAAIAAIRAGRTYVPAHARAAHVDRGHLVVAQSDERACGDRAEDVRETLLHARATGKDERWFSVVCERERDVGICERDRGEKGRDPREFSRRRTHVFASNGHVCEEIAHDDPRTRRRGDGLGFADVEIVRVDRVSDLQFRRSRNQTYACDCRDTREPFAAEPERRNALEIGRLAQFTRRVARECKPHLMRRDARSVVGDFDRFETAASDRDGDARGPRIERIFDEFLHHADRALDDFARGDLADGTFVEPTDHGMTS